MADSARKHVNAREDTENQPLWLSKRTPESIKHELFPYFLLCSSPFPLLPPSLPYPLSSPRDSHQVLVCITLRTQSLLSGSQS